MAVVGLLYPCIDSHLGEPHKFKREWASVMRCIAVFVGINHASAVYIPRFSLHPFLASMYIFLRRCDCRKHRTPTGYGYSRETTQ
ncbi:hypothetical protein llap_13558 [Limosa lapponica baueri]|uniref:Insulin-induced gene 1 protein n=1 Tax=Limosa lapponica baueri TaxID=1758121 RepID=A0A2I0TQR5_LIMLA|nr:hypothetical protein llap_13558 [Limosa lapponica baueri]